MGMLARVILQVSVDWGMMEQKKREGFTPRRCSQIAKTCSLLFRRLLSPSMYRCSCLVREWSRPISD